MPLHHVNTAPGGECDGGESQIDWGKREQCGTQQSVDRDLKGNSGSDMHQCRGLMVRGMSPWMGGIEDDLHLAQVVRNSGKPNVYGVRIPVSTNWNFDLLNSLATTVTDREVVQYLRFGWPLNRELDVPLTITLGNHMGARQYPEEVDRYLQKELHFGALVGPLCSLPAGDRMAVSPMTTRAKKNSVHRRIISDLSWPPGASVNDGIPKHEYCGQLVKIRYPTVDQLCKRAVLLSRGQKRGQIKGFKVDMKRAFRQISTCPRDWTLLGSYWRGALFLDKVTVMGSRTGPLACQRVTNMIRHFMSDMGYDVSNFVDDFMGIELLSEVFQAYGTLKRLLKDLGVSEAVDKAVPPSYTVEFLGILFNLLDLTMAIPDEKVEEIKEELEHWMCKQLSTRKQLESVLGKLQFAATCVRQGRVFVARIIVELKGMHRCGLHPIGEGLRKDVIWWRRALEDRNLVSMMWLQECVDEQERLVTDATLLALGGKMGNQCFRCRIAKNLTQNKQWSIVHFEILAVIVAVQVWQSRIKGKRLRMYCDNQAVVMVINTGRARDEVLQMCLRWLCYLLTLADSMVKMEYIETKHNKCADILSRSFHSEVARDNCDTMIRENDLVEVEVKMEMMEPHVKW